MEKHTNRIINKIEEGIVIVDKNGYIQSINKQTQELLEINQSKVIGKKFNEAFNILNNDCKLNDLLKIYSNSLIKSNKCILDVNGFYKTITFNVEVIEENDKLMGIIVFIRDITELERAQEILKNSEAKFKSLYNSMLSAYTLREIIYDDQGNPIDFRYVEVNPAFEKVSGKKRKEVIGKTYTEVFTDRQPYWLEVYKKVAKTGEPVDYENWMKSTNKYLKVHVFKVGKNYLGVITVDLTRNKKLENELNREREIFKNLYSSMQNGYALCEIILDEKNLDFKYLEANPAFLEMIDMNRIEVIGKRASEVSPKGRQMDYEKTNNLVRKYKEAALSGNVTRFDIHSNVMNRDLEVIVYGFGDGRFAVEFIDITDRKRLREELIREREKYYNLFNSMLDGFVLFETVKGKSGEVKDFLIADMNPASEGETGFKSKDVKGQLLSQVFANSRYSLEKSLNSVLDLYKKSMNSENNEASGYIEGFYKYLYVSAFIPKEEQFAVILRDFTEQKILEEEVFKEKELFRSLFDNTLSGFALNEVIFDENDNPIDFIGLLVNPAFLEIAGFEEKDVLGVAASEVFDVGRYGYWPKDSLIHDYAKVLKTGKPIRKEYYSNTFKKYLDVSIAKVNGNVVALSFNDITEKKRVEENLKWNLNVLKQAQEIAKIGSWEYYHISEKLWLSEETKEMYGINKDGDLNVEEILNYISEEDLDKFTKYFFEINEREERKFDITHKTKEINGKVTHIHLKGIISGSIDNFVVVGVAQDITELVEAQQDLAENEAKFRTIINSTSDAIVIYDENLNVTYRSGNIARIFGWEVEDFEDKGNFDLLLPEDVEKTQNILKEVIKKGPNTRREFEARIRDKEGNIRYTRHTIVNMLDDPHINGLLINYYDITEAKEREAEILYLSTHDELTGLYNRSYFERHEDEFVKEENLPLTVIMGDLNGLKLINDMFGHSEGDKLLKEMAEIIKSCCKKEAIPIRFGGDEYCVISFNTTHLEAESVLTKIKQECAKYKKSSENELLYPSVSLGFDTITDKTKSLSEALRVAEDEMYKSKLYEGKSVHSASALIASTKAAMHEKSFETEEHSSRLSIYSKEIGKHLDLSENELQELSFAAELHDIGKIGIDNSILTKPGKLNDKEWNLIREHPEIGYRIAQSSGELNNIADYILNHHERWDGEGYPMGLKKEEIPLFSRIIAIVDAFDVMTSDRPYREKISKEKAEKELKLNAGTQFDPKLVRIFNEKVIDDIELDN